MVLSPVEGRVKSIPNIFNFNTQTVVILDSFNGRKLAFVDPIHKKLWTSFFICDFLYFEVKKCSFHLLDYVFEFFPIFNVLRTYTIPDPYCNYCSTNF